MPKWIPLPEGGALKEPTDEDIALIEKWASDGAALIQMARALKIDQDTLRAWRQRHPRVNEALEAGKEVEHQALRGKAFEMAMNGNPIMVMFLLKTRHGYREGEVLQQASRLNITFSLPGARKLETIELDDAEHRTERLPAPRA